MYISTLTPDKQVILQYWLDVIRQCRDSSLANQAWCGQHDISLKSCYYWIAKIRKLALEELPRKSHGCRPLQKQCYILTLCVELFEDTPCELLEAILKAVGSCQETSPGLKTYLSTGCTDMRKQLDCLVDIIQYSFQADSYSKSLFLF